jgi:4-hydroxybenzoate polyprenyltransferase
LSLRDLGRLLRLSLLPSALADVAGGVVLGNLGHWPVGAGPWWLLGSSASVYHGAMALNDWRDREHDRATRPTRPIPSGAVPAGTALTLALLLLGFGPLLALQHSREAALWSLGLSLLAASYDLVGRGPLLGPLLLAACRAGNLGLGLFLGSGELGGGAPTRCFWRPWRSTASTCCGFPNWVAWRMERPPWGTRARGRTFPPLLSAVVRGGSSPPRPRCCFSCR